MRGRGVRIGVVQVALLVALHGRDGFSGQTGASDVGPGAPGTTDDSPGLGGQNTELVAKFRLDWRVAATCFEAQHFRQRIADLTKRITWSDDAAQVVAVTMNEHGVAAVLEMFDKGALTWRRVIPGRWDCQTLARALAFALAVAIDPDASTVQVDTSAGAPSTDDEVAVAISAWAAKSDALSASGGRSVGGRGVNLAEEVLETDRAAANDPPALSRRSRQSPSNDLASLPHERPRASTRDVWAGVGPTVMAGIGDGLALGASVLVTSRTAPAPRESWQWLPDVGLGASYLRLEDHIGRVSALGDLATADVRLRPVRWTAIGCNWFLDTGLTLGALSVTAQNVDVASRRTTLWAAGEASLGLQWALASTSVDLAFGLGWQFSQPHFLVQRTQNDEAPRRLLTIPGPALIARLRVFLPTSRSKAPVPNIDRVE